MEMDGERKAPVYQRGGDCFFNAEGCELKIKWNAVGDGLVEARAVSGGSFSEEIKAGNRIVLRHHRRNYPVIYIEDSKKLVLSDLWLCHGLGMGVIAQFSEDITVNRVKVSPSAGSIFSMGADATHFVYCRGKIEVKGCFFENQMDDAVNVHGIYQRVEKILSPTELVTKLVHHQQKGVRLGKAGERLSFSDSDTMLSYGDTVIEEIRILNKDYTYIRLKEALSGVKEGDVAENIEYVPDVRIENCLFQNNRARGVLLTTAGKVEVVGNTFASAGAAILIEGDSKDWFESGATKEIRIHHNVFKDCSYVPVWGAAPIQVSPSARKTVERKYHGSMEITENTFYAFDDRLLKAKNMERLIFANNKIIKTNTFPKIDGERFLLQDINHWEEKENEFLPII